MDTPQDARVDSKYVPVYLDLAGKAGKILPEELAGELQGRTSIPYKMNMPCRVGQVLQHERFGIGIVTEIRRADNTKKVYFPKEQRFIPMA